MGGPPNLQIFGIGKIIPSRHFRPNLITHMQYHQFWAFIYHLGASIVIIPAPQSINEGGNFFYVICYINKPEQAIELHSNPNKKKIIEKNFKNRKLDRKSGFQGKTGSRTKFVRQYFCIQKLPRPCRVQIYTY